MNDTLIEIALREMKSKRKPRTLTKIAKDVFEVKGLNIKEEEKTLAQFQMDFMLSGYFICCGEDKNGNKIWDLKSRQPSTLLDKDGSYLEDLYDYDEEVVKHELKDEVVYKKTDDNFESDSDDDDDEESEEQDEIEEELLSEGIGVDDEKDEQEDADLIDDLDEEDLDEDFDDDFEEDYDDEDDEDDEDDDEDDEEE
ncbi:MAG: hypothetical protein PHX62_00230 [Bacilli bacterium]|nr:hypothetical protein [Bacilli bacterium]